MLFRNLKRISILLTPLILLFFFTSCSKLKIDKPDGFAEIKKTRAFKKGELYKAISPEGMLFRIRIEKNYPEMDLAFWSDTLKTHLIKEGYTILDNETEEDLPEKPNNIHFETKDNKGIIFKWVLPYNNESYIYMTALLVCDNEILIAEATGEHTIFRSHYESILKTLQSINY